MAIKRIAVDPENWWRTVAACADVSPIVFYPPDVEGRGGVRTGVHRAAKAVCADCPVVGSCLHDAMSRGERFGIWGGTDASERRELKRRVVVSLLPRESPLGRRTRQAGARAATVAHLRLDRSGP